ncbi:unnamed protein product [Paramecium primaurelia]|uniref:Uncharacterized protein n=1 Tax=Paramecium primaurelia TaxID=5886 RepID=A0A8S1JMN4_PARPR|nr:unnamed protein product [Paramecium primaurelia]
MKYLLFLAIILIALAKRHHQPDAVLSCLQGTCKEEFDICDNSTGCLKQLKKCMKVQERDPFNYSAGYECLEQQKTALDAFECIFGKCLGVHGE